MAPRVPVLTNNTRKSHRARTSSRRRWPVIDQLKIGATVLPVRAVRVPGHGTLAVPRYVVRLDTDAGNPGGPLHGWQLRYGRAELFSDRHYGKDPSRSLAAAIARLKRWIRRKPPTPALPIRELARKKMPLGVRGVMLTKRPRRPGGSMQISVAVCVAVWGDAPARNLHIYIGTTNTVSAQKLSRALRIAKAIRQYGERCYRRREAKPMTQLSVHKLPAAVRRLAQTVTLPTQPSVATLLKYAKAGTYP